MNKQIRTNENVRLVLDQNTGELCIDNVECYSMVYLYDSKGALQAHTEYVTEEPFSCYLSAPGMYILVINNPQSGYVVRQIYY